MIPKLKSIPEIFVEMDRKLNQVPEQSASTKKELELSLAISLEIRSVLEEKGNITQGEIQYANNIDRRLLNNLKTRDEKLKRMTSTLSPKVSEHLLPIINLLINGFTHCALHLEDSSKEIFPILEALGKTRTTIESALYGEILYPDFSSLVSPEVDPETS